MIEATPSRTALRVALRRAAHQIVDSRPLVFDDPLAVRILPAEQRRELGRTPNAERRPFSAALRAFMVARARLAEDLLQSFARGGGPVQYLVLGAGLDTFACRNPHANVDVFEVDHPATQAWKLECLRHASLVPKPGTHFVAVDFEKDSLRARLIHAGLDASRPTLTAWLGVVPYLTHDAFRATLNVLAGLGREARGHNASAPGSRVLFDYSQPRDVLPYTEQLMHDSLSARVAQAGEPFQLFFTPTALEDLLQLHGIRVHEDIGSVELNARYFAGRADGLRLRGSAGRFCVAEC